MGCFASTCPISGLAIEHNDPVRFGFLQLKEKEFRRHWWLLRPTSLFNFWTPTYKGVYDHYGCVEWEQIENRESFEYLLSLFRPSLRNLREYSQNVDIVNSSDEELFRAMSVGGVVYDPYRELREKIKDEPNRNLLESLTANIHGEQEFYFFMMHEWAYQFVINCESWRPQLLKEIRDEIEEYIKTQPEKKFELDEATKEISRDSREFSDHYYEIITKTDELRYIQGDTSAFGRVNGFRYIFSNLPTLEHKKDLIQRIEETVLFVYGLQLIRKPLIPVHTIGASQSERNEYIKPWLELLNKKAKKQYSEFE